MVDVRCSYLFTEFLLALANRHFRTLYLTTAVVMLAVHGGWAQQFRTPTTVYQPGYNAGDASLVPAPQLSAPNYGSGTGVNLNVPGFDPYATTTAPNAA